MLKVPLCCNVCFQDFFFLSECNLFHITTKAKWQYCKVPCKHKILRKVGGGRLLGILPFVQSIIQPLKEQVNTKRLEFKQKSYLFQF